MSFCTFPTSFTDLCLSSCSDCKRQKHFKLEGDGIQKCYAITNQTKFYQERYNTAYTPVNPLIAKTSTLHTAPHTAPRTPHALPHAPLLPLALQACHRISHSTRRPRGGVAMACRRISFSKRRSCKLAPIGSGTSCLVSTVSTPCTTSALLLIHVCTKEKCEFLQRLWY